MTYEHLPLSICHYANFMFCIGWHTSFYCFMIQFFICVIIFYLFIYFNFSKIIPCSSSIIAKIDLFLRTNQLPSSQFLWPVLSHLVRTPLSLSNYHFTHLQFNRDKKNYLLLWHLCINIWKQAFIIILILFLKRQANLYICKIPNHATDIMTRISHFMS